MSRGVALVLVSDGSDDDSMVDGERRAVLKTSRSNCCNEMGIIVERLRPLGSVPLSSVGLDLLCFVGVD